MGYIVQSVRIKKIVDDAIIPTYATPGSACFDLYSAQDVSFEKSCVISTGLAFEIPEGWQMLIFGRSGHAFKDDVRLANCVGVVDSDYRGEVKVKLTCDGDTSMSVNKGDRIAQAQLVPVYPVTFSLVDQLKETSRGIGGFGSTGR